MTSRITNAAIVPPLRLAWRAETGFETAVAGNNNLYGITGTGQLQSLDGATGAARWVATHEYLPTRLTRQGRRLFAYRRGQGLGFLDDNGGSVAESLVVSFAATDTTGVSDPVLDGEYVYVAVNQGLYAVHQEDGLQFGTVLSDVRPHALTVIGPRKLLSIDGRGVPTRYNVGAEGFEPVWVGAPHGVDGGQTYRRFAVVGNRLVVGVGPETVAYNLDNGAVAWRLPGTPARVFVADEERCYAGFHGAAVWAIRPADGSVLWQRQYMYDIGLQLEYGMTGLGNRIYFGGALQGQPDGALLLALNKADGTCEWISRSATRPWSGGIPLADGERLYCYTPSQAGAHLPLTGSPQVGRSNIEVTPASLRGQAAQFGDGSVRLSLPGAARVTVAAYREAEGLGTMIMDNRSLPAGTHTATWSQAGPGGLTDANQFSHILVDVVENSGLQYTQTVLLPVNTFPDILAHWARNYIQTMAYHKYVSGYPDLLFRPNNLVTRAESATIIAKTLHIEGPSAGFRTRFTDIAGHWASPYIAALEERSIISGFAEPDGSFTFRPELSMTRSQQARILGRAYAVPPAPPEHATRFTDIRGHWAEADIKALEAAGYVTGFLEADGTYTFRPENSLTRAEMCTVIVRIRGLIR